MAENFESFARETQSTDQRYQQNLEAIIAKYERPFPESDIVELNNMKIVVDNGHLRCKKEKVFGKTKLPTTRLKEMKKSEKSDSGIGSINTSEAFIPESPENETFSCGIGNVSKAQLTVLEDMYDKLLDAPDDVDLSDADELSSTLSSVSDDGTDTTDNSLIMCDDDDGWESDSSGIVKSPAHAKSNTQLKTSHNGSVEERSGGLASWANVDDASFKKSDGLTNAKPKCIVLRRNSSSNEDDLLNSSDGTLSFREGKSSVELGALLNNSDSSDNFVVGEALEAGPENASKGFIGKQSDFVWKSEHSTIETDIGSLVDDSSPTEDNEEDVTPKSEPPGRNDYKRHKNLNETFTVDGGQILKNGYRCNRNSVELETRRTYKQIVSPVSKYVHEEVSENIGYEKAKCGTKSHNSGCSDSHRNIEMYVNTHHEMNRQTATTNSSSFRDEDASHQVDIESPVKLKANESLPKRSTVSHNFTARSWDDRVSVSPKLRRQLQSPRKIQRFSHEEMISILSSPKPFVIDSSDTLSDCYGYGVTGQERMHGRSLSHVVHQTQNLVSSSPESDMKTGARCLQKSCEIETFNVQMNGPPKQAGNAAKENVHVDQRTLGSVHVKENMVSKETVDKVNCPSRAKQELSIKKSWDNICSLIKDDRNRGKAESPQSQREDAFPKRHQKSVRRALLKPVENNVFTGHIEEKKSTQNALECNRKKCRKNTVCSESPSRDVLAENNSPSTMLRKMQLFSPSSKAKQHKQANSVINDSTKAAKKKIARAIIPGRDNDGAIKNESGNTKEARSPKVSRRLESMDAPLISTPSKSDISVLDISSISSISQSSSLRFFDDDCDGDDNNYDNVNTIVIDDDDDDVSEQSETMTATVLEQPFRRRSSRTCRDDGHNNDNTENVFAHHKAVVSTEKLDFSKQNLFRIENSSMSTTSMTRSSCHYGSAMQVERCMTAKSLTKTSCNNDTANLITQHRAVVQSERFDPSKENLSSMEWRSLAADCVTKINRSDKRNEPKASVHDMSIDDSVSSEDHRKMLCAKVKQLPQTQPSSQSMPILPTRLLRARKSLSRWSPYTKYNTRSDNSKGKIEKQKQRNSLDVGSSPKHSGANKPSESLVFTSKELIKLNVHTVHSAHPLNMSLCLGPGKCTKTFCFTCFSE